MALQATLYRFKISLSDIDRGKYEQIDLRIAKHPSEVDEYMLSRVLAYSLNFEFGIEFPPGGLSDPDQPAIRLMNDRGQLDLTVEIGNPPPKKLHKASKASSRVRVYTYKDPALLLKEMAGEKVHRAEEIEIFSFSPGFLRELVGWLERDNEWSLVIQENTLTVSSSKGNAVGELLSHKFGQ